MKKILMTAVLFSCCAALKAGVVAPQNRPIVKPAYTPQLSDVNIFMQHLHEAEQRAAQQGLQRAVPVSGTVKATYVGR